MLTATAAWALLDAVVAIVCDATAPILDRVGGPLLAFLRAVAWVAGGGGVRALAAAPRDRGAALGVAGGPAGLHPTTLWRMLQVGLNAHSLAAQKRASAGAWLAFLEGAGGAAEWGGARAK
jgi:hypothetical protein